MVVVAIGWITTKDEQYAVLPPAMTMQVGLYQLAKAEPKEVPVGPEQVMSVPEAAEPEPMKEQQLDVPKMPIVEQGTYGRELRKKPKVKPVVKPKPVIKSKMPDDLPRFKRQQIPQPALYQVKRDQ